MSLNVAECRLIWHTLTSYAESHNHHYVPPFLALCHCCPLAEVFPPKSLAWRNPEWMDSGWKRLSAVFGFGVTILCSPEITLPSAYFGKMGRCYTIIEYMKTHWTWGCWSKWSRCTIQNYGDRSDSVFGFSMTYIWLMVINRRLCLVLLCVNFLLALFLFIFYSHVYCFISLYPTSGLN